MTSNNICNSLYKIKVMVGNQEIVGLIKLNAAYIAEVLFFFISQLSSKEG